MTARNALLLGLVAAIAAAAAFWFLALSPKREESRKLSDQIAQAESRKLQADTQAAGYEQAKRSFAANYRSIAALGKAVPADDDVRSLVYQLDQAAKAAGVDFRSIEAGAGRSSGTPATASASTPGGASASQAATATLPPGATVGSAGLGVMPFSFAFTGSFFDLSDFFARLERFVQTRNDQVSVTGRLLLLDGLSLKPDTTGWPHIRANVVATSLLVPPTEGLFAGATPQGPAKATPVAVTDRSAATTSTASEVR